MCPPPASAFSELKSSPEQRWVALPAHCAPLSAAQGGSLSREGREGAALPSVNFSQRGLATGEPFRSWGSEPAKGCPAPRRAETPLSGAVPARGPPQPEAGTSAPGAGRRTPPEAAAQRLRRRWAPRPGLPALPPLPPGRLGGGAPAFR